MITSYEKALYEFYPDEENYETFAKIADQASNIGDKLVKDFWSEVITQLREQIKNWEGTWTVLPPKNHNERYANIKIVNSEWKDDSGETVMAICYEYLHFGDNPYVGLWFNNILKDKYDVGSIFSEIRNLEGLKEYKHDSNLFWIKWKYLSFALITYENLQKIIPSNRETTLQAALLEAEALKDLLSNLSEILRRNNNQ